MARAQNHRQNARARRSERGVQHGRKGVLDFMIPREGEERKTKLLAHAIPLDRWGVRRGQGRAALAQGLGPLSSWFKQKFEGSGGPEDPPTRPSNPQRRVSTRG